MKNHKPILNDKIIDQVAKDGSKLEVQPDVDFIRELERKLMFAYQEQENKYSLSWRDKIRKLLSYITHMNNIQKVSFVALTLVVIVAASYTFINRSEVVQAFQGFPQKVRQIFVPQVDKQGKVTFSTSTIGDIVTSTNGLTVRSASTSLGRLSLDELVQKKLVEVILDEHIEGEKVTGVRYTDGDLELFIGDKESELVSYMPGIKTTYNVEEVRQGMRDRAQTVVSTQKLNQHLEREYHVKQYSSLDDLMKDVSFEIIKEFPQHEDGSRFAVVRFPDGTKVLVSQTITTVYTPTSTGVKKQMLSFEAYSEDQFDINTGMMKIF
jgi:hypothetical protein